MEKARVFRSGRSQLVRLPKAFRFDTDDVRIRRVGQTVMLEALAGGGAWPDEGACGLDDDFVRATQEAVPQPGTPESDPAPAAFCLQA